MSPLDPSSPNHLQLQHQPSRLSLVVESRWLPKFYYLLQLGFGLHVQLGGSVQELLNQQLGLDSEYVAGRISTVFLDGRPVDNLEAALIREGATLALSAAMPGLVGATLRRGGYYAVLRSSITHVADTGSASQQLGTITVKLFNLLQNDLGPLFLERGILVQSAALLDFFARQNADFWHACLRLNLDGSPIAASVLMSGAWPAPGQVVVLSVAAGEGN
jgi:hypothetical protein